MKVARVTQNTRIWCATSVTRRSTLTLIVGITKRNNKKLMPLNWLKKMKISVTFYQLQTVRSVTKIDGSLTLGVLNTSVLIRKCSPHTL